MTLSAPTQEQVHEEGAVALRAGIPLDNNPYNPDDQTEQPFWVEWQYGWLLEFERVGKILKGRLQYLRFLLWAGLICASAMIGLILGMMFSPGTGQ